MTHEQQQIIQFVEKSISELLIEVALHPIAHFSEKSLQLTLSSRLLSSPLLSTPIATGITKKYDKELTRISCDEQSSQPRRIDQYHSEAYKCIPLQMEYGNNMEGAYRVDIVIFDPTMIRNIVCPNLKDGTDCYLQPLIAIEFGTEKIGWEQMNSKHLDSDFNKVKQSTKGYIINVMRNSNFSPRNSGRNEAKQNRIKAFRDKLSSFVNASENVVWIGLIVDIALAEATFLGSDHKWHTFLLPDQQSEFQTIVHNRFNKV